MRSPLSGWLDGWPTSAAFNSSPEPPVIDRGPDCRGTPALKHSRGSRAMPTLSLHRARQRPQLTRHGNAKWGESATFPCVELRAQSPVLSSRIVLRVQTLRRLPRKPTYHSSDPGGLRCSSPA
ncbi:hypothetical protein AAFF_G00416600 [Aldrovandia affinis]|uniref:Uncharacterized protein n=1 Tax=Aldrovandia affinis TaxID=143900 RepID=A0AAD7SAU0_9TELE|nr:hypothetical protein AAFF_G00416600 [Aldrovandia affinis]